MTEEECVAADRGDCVFLRKRLRMLQMEFLLARDSRGGNILHRLLQSSNLNVLAVYHDIYDLIREALGSFPLLLCQTDVNGNNPVHIVAVAIGFGLDQFVPASERILDCFYHSFLRAQKEDSNFREVVVEVPWRMKNLEGDTPLHKAVKIRHAKTIKKLAEFDDVVLSYVNNQNETPLHLLSSAHIYTDGNYMRLVRATMLALNERDAEGLTPLLRAARYYNIELVKIFYDCSYDPGKYRDSNGQTFLHLLACPPIKRFHIRLPDRREIIFEDDSRHLLEMILKVQDNEGNTALHAALLSDDFHYAQLILKCQLRRREFGYSTLDTPNNAGVTPRALIGAAKRLPPTFEEFLRSQYYLMDCRSYWGVPTSEMKDYSNTMGVVAALLATITFTAAFTVPGGFNSNNGTPLLMKNVAFKVFLVSDIVAMCLSMMVLFCLLWIVTTDSEGQSVILLDLSLFLLQASFYATLLTFMMGFYATTFTIMPWIAIFGCVVCSLLIILMHKYFVVKLLNPLVKRLTFEIPIVRSKLEAKILGRKQVSRDSD